MSNSKLFMEGHELAVLNRYYIWLTDMIDFDSHDNYSRLLEYLHNKDFVWKIDNDVNRAKDGIYLREKFKGETDYLDYSILEKPCSVLEMLVAFASRIDKEVVPDEDEIDKTGDWFWFFMDNLGLIFYDDDRFEVEKVDEILDIWMNRKDEKVVKSGLFTKKSGKAYQKNEEIWYEMQRFIVENYTK